MKTLKSILSGVALLLVCFAANATVKPVADKPTKTDVLNIYIDAVTKGNTADLAKVLDADLQFNIQRGESVTTLDKTQLFNYMKNNQNSTAATTTTTTLSETNRGIVVQIDFKYADYVRTDVVTISNDAGWKITNIDSTYK